MQVLSVLLSPAYFTDFRLSCLLACRIVNISVLHGRVQRFRAGYACFGNVLGRVFHRYGEGYRFTKLACELVEKHGFIA